jgi:hypothetical protein
MPPLYEETIVLCLDDDGTMWLWLQNYEDVFFADGSPHAVIGLKISLGIFAVQDPPPYDTRVSSISSYLDVAEVILFQQAILAHRNDRSQKSLKSYSLGLIFAALKAIGFAPPDNAQPTDRTLPKEWIKRYLVEYAKAKHRRSDWERGAGYSPTNPVWNYKGQIEGLLLPTQYKLYEELGFIGYFPKPSFVLQEQKTRPVDDPTERPNDGQTANRDPRSIELVESRVLERVPTNLTKLPAAIDEFFQKIDDRILEQESQTSAPSKSRKKTKSKTSAPSESPDISGVSSLKKLNRGLERVTCYAFRGDSRDPIAIRAAGGFFCNVTRKKFFHEDLPEQAAIVDSTLKKASEARPNGSKTEKDEETPATLFEALLKFKVFDLKNYIVSEHFGGFISTTTSIAIAKCFSNFWQNTMYNYPKDPKNSQNFCYAMRAINGFVLPSNKDTTAELKTLHEFLRFPEQEVAVPGMIGWNEVFGFRLCRVQSQGQVFAGPVWILKSVPNIDRPGFQSLFDLLSGKSQGAHEKIFKSYPVPPFELGSSTFPKKSELLSQKSAL